MKTNPYTFDPAEQVRVDKNTIQKWLRDRHDFSMHQLPVNVDLEIAKVMAILEAERGYRPTVLFSNVQEYPAFCVWMNSFKRELIHQQLGSSSTSFLPTMYERMTNGQPQVNLRPCQNLKKLASLHDIPVLKHQPRDAGRYITAGVTAARSVQSGRINLGIYRIQVRGARTALIFMDPRTHGYQYHQESLAQGMALEVAVFVGANPAFYVIGASSIPEELDSYQACSKLLGKPIVLFSLSIPVPVEAQLVIMGRVTKARDWDGPFGEHKGYYGEERSAFVFEVDDILCAEEPVYYSICAGKESGLVLTALQNEVFLYTNLRSRGFELTSVKYTLEGKGQYIVLIETPQPSEELIRTVFDLDRRAKFVIVGKEITNPWIELGLFPYHTVRDQYCGRGKVEGERVGFVFEHRSKLWPVEL